MDMSVTCKKAYGCFIAGKTYPIINSDMFEYCIRVNCYTKKWISKNDTEHFKYNI